MTTKNDPRRGRCPLCGHELNFTEGDLDDDDYVYRWTCEGCRARGEERYALRFVGHAVLEVGDRPVWFSAPESQTTDPKERKDP
jgi:hypothetical protein